MIIIHIPPPETFICGFPAGKRCYHNIIIFIITRHVKENIDFLCLFLRIKDYNALYALIMNFQTGFMNKSIIKFFCLFIPACLSSLCCLSCHISPAVKPGESDYQADLPLDKKYKKIILFKFEAESYLEKSYPEAAALCENSVMAELLKKSSVSRIEKSRSGSFRGAGAILVMVYLTYARPGGKNTGGTELTADLKLMDAETGNIVRTNKLSAAKNTAAGKHKSSGNSLPADLGQIIAGYLAYIIRGE